MERSQSIWPSPHCAEDEAEVQRKSVIWDTLCLNPKASDFPMSIVDLSDSGYMTQIINLHIDLFGNSFKVFVFLIFIGVKV